jgi:hypothetical protein
VSRPLLFALALSLPAVIVRLSLPGPGRAASFASLGASVLGLCLLRPQLAALTRAGVAEAALLLAFYATFLWRDVILAENIDGALRFLLATGALGLWWTRGRALGKWAVGLLLIALVGLSLPLPSRLSHPRLLETLFSSRGGLLFWNPVLWGGLVGGLVRFRRDPRSVSVLALVALVVLLLDAAFTAHAVLPILIVGLALAVDGLQRVAARRPALVLAAGGLALVAWNALLMAQYRANRLPADDSVSFSRVTENSAALLSETVGTPLAWPANWIFALEHRVAPGEFDLRAGKRLFTTAAQRGARIDAGDPRTDPALFSDGWTSARPCGDVLCRGVMGEARLFVPLEAPEALSLVLATRGTGNLLLALNGVGLGGLALTPGLSEHRLRVPEARFRRGLNELSFRSDAGAEAWLDWIELERDR